MKQFLIVKTGSTFPNKPLPGDFEDWTARGMGVPDSRRACWNVQANDPEPEGDWAGVVVTGSHDMVTDREDWMIRAGKSLAALAERGLPILGICFGHQLLADFLGGRAGYCPKGLEAGTADITLTPEAKDDPLFGALPETFPAHVTHSQSALELPPDALILAANGHEPHHAFRMGRHVWGVQFHPEFNEIACRHYVLELAQVLRDRGADPEALAGAVRPTPESASLLTGFTAYCDSLD